MMNKHSSKDESDKFVQKYLYIDDFYIDKKKTIDDEVKKDLDDYPGVVIIQIL